MKKMTQSIKAKFLSITTIILVTVIGICTLSVTFCVQAAMHSQDMMHELYIYSENFRTASEYLTSEARAYACTGNEENYNNYMRELNTDKRRTVALDAMKELGLTDEELQIIEQISGISDKLVPVEEKAFAAAKANDIATAYSLLYSDDYVKNVKQISDLIDDFDALVEERMSEVVYKNQTLSTVADLITLFFVVVAFVFQILTMKFILKDLIVPIVKTELKMQQFLEGNMHEPFDVPIDDTEIGKTSAAINRFQEYQTEIIADINYLLGEMAKGNFVLKTRCEEHYLGDYANILQAVRTINRRLSATLSKINVASLQVDNGAIQVSSASVQLSQGATEQASSIEQLSSTINVISNMIKNNADEAVSASNKTNVAGKELVHANERISELVNAMNEISASSSETKKIIKTIEDIAFQTNILALNAAVEAARAGAAGKGFAVVADEVRNLAGKSAEAASQTTALIESTVAAIDKGNALVNEVASNMSVVEDAAGTVSEINQKIAESSREAADAIRQVTIGIDQISTVVQTNSATAEQTAAASEELNAQADTCMKLIEQFNLRNDV